MRERGRGEGERGEGGEVGVRGVRDQLLHTTSLVSREITVIAIQWASRFSVSVVKVIVSERGGCVNSPWGPYGYTDD